MNPTCQIHGEELRAIRDTLNKFAGKLDTLAGIQADQASEQKLHGERLAHINDHLRTLNGRTAANEALGATNSAAISAHQFKIEASEKDRSILWKKLSALEAALAAKTVAIESDLRAKVAALDNVLGELRTSMAVAMATAKGVVQGATTTGKTLWAALGAAGGAIATAAAVWASMR